MYRFRISLWERELAAGEHRGPASPRDAKFNVVGGEHDGTPLRCPLAEQVAKHLSRVLVQPGLGLVQQQDVGLMQDGAGDGRPTLHPVRQRADAVIGAGR